MTPSIEQLETRCVPSSMAFNPRAWIRHGYAVSDIRQGTAPTCSLLAAMAAEMHGAGWKPSIARAAPGAGFERYVVVFPAGQFSWSAPHAALRVLVSFDGTYTNFDPQPSEPGEFWTILVQRAFVKLDARDPDILAGGLSSPAHVMEVLTGGWGIERHSSLPVKGTVWVDQWITEFPRSPMVVATWSNVTGPRIVPYHAYAVMGMIARGLTLYNPWGLTVFVSWTAYSRNFSFVVVD